MLRIEARVNHYRKRIDFIGHADYAELGKDIVCSAVSALAHTLAYNVNADIKGGDGHRYIEYSGNSDVTHTIINGLLLIAEQYPQNVEVFSF